MMAVSGAVVLVLLLVPGTTGRGEEAELEIRPLVEQGLRRTFEGRRDEADEIWATLRSVAPDHPAGFVHQVGTLFWRQMYDEADTRFDEAIETFSEQGIRACEARLAVDPNDAAAHDYMGQALLHLGRLEGIRGRILGAASFGERGREHLERALEIDPQRLDVRYPLGLYYYYADRATRWFKWLQWLWFIPSGDGPTGLRWIREASRRQGPHRHDAQLVLADIQAHHEPTDLARATALAEDLHAQFPRNTLLHSLLIELYLRVGRHQDAIEEALELEKGDGRDELDELSRAVAPMWRARAWLLLGDLDRAAAVLAVVPALQRRRPFWAGAWGRLSLAQLHDLRGERAEAEALYREVISLAPPYESRRASELARAGLDRPFRVERARGRG